MCIIIETNILGRALPFDNRHRPTPISAKNQHLDFTASINCCTASPSRMLCFSKCRSANVANTSCTASASASIGARRFRASSSCSRELRLRCDSRPSRLGRFAGVVDDMGTGLVIRGAAAWGFSKLLGRGGVSVEQGDGKR